jgi:hypothetical protein
VACLVVGALDLIVCARDDLTGRAEYDGAVRQLAGSLGAPRLGDRFALGRLQDCSCYGLRR